MKGNQPSYYFSAYPLKAIKSAEKKDNQSPYLRSILAGGTSVKNSSRVRVFPMINPYKAPISSPRSVKKAKDVNSGTDEWYNHYE